MWAGDPDLCLAAFALTEKLDFIINNQLFLPFLLSKIIAVWLSKSEF